MVRVYQSNFGCKKICYFKKNIIVQFIKTQVWKYIYQYSDAILRIIYIVNWLVQVLCKIQNQHIVEKEAKYDQRGYYRQIKTKGKLVHCWSKNSCVLNIYIYIYKFWVFPLLGHQKSLESKWN